MDARHQASSNVIVVHFIAGPTVFVLLVFLRLPEKVLAQ